MMRCLPSEIAMPDRAQGSQSSVKLDHLWCTYPATARFVTCTYHKHLHTTGAHHPCYLQRFCHCSLVHDLVLTYQSEYTALSIKSRCGWLCRRNRCSIWKTVKLTSPVMKMRRMTWRTLLVVMKAPHQDLLVAPALAKEDQVCTQHSCVTE